MKTLTVLNIKILLLLLCTSSFHVFSQNQRNLQNAKIDSLKQIVNNPISVDTSKTYGYVDLIIYYTKNDEDSCRAYFKKMFDYAKSHNSPLAYHKYYFLKANRYNLFKEPDDEPYEFINDNFVEALSYSKKLNRPGLVEITYYRLAQENSRFGEKDKALVYAFEGEKVAIQNRLWQDLANIYGQIGKIYNLNFHKTDKALQYLLKSDSIFASNNFKGLDYGFTLSFIGDVYQSLEDLEQAKSYQNKALSIFKIAENGYQQNFISGKLAIIEREQKNYEKALAYISDAISYYKENKLPIQVAVCLTIESDIYLDSGQLDKALEVGQQAIDLCKENNYELGLLTALINQSKIVRKKNSFSQSNQLALEAEELALKMNAFAELKDIYELLYLNSENLGDYKQAYQYSNKHRSVSDTLVFRANIKTTKNLEAKYQSEKKEKEIALLHSKNDLAQQQKVNQRNLLLGGIGLTSIAGLFFFFLYRNRQKTTRKLKELDQFKSKFFTNISHEFRTPLTLISGPIEKRLNNPKLNETDRNELQMIQRNSNRLLNLTNQLLDLSKLESGHLQLKVIQGNLTLLLKAIASSFEHAANQKEINYTIDIVETQSVWFDKDVIEKIVSNLLSNAFKYTPKGGIITCKASVIEHTLEIYIENNSQKLSKIQIEHIFNRFYQVDENSDGVGIGLSLVKELVTLSHGHISVKNTSANKIAFTVVLPLLKTQFQLNEIVDTTFDSSAIEIKNVMVETENQSEQIIDEDLPILLIVDDQQDIRNFIKSAFKNTYQVVEASNGDVGVAKAIELIPDIIISDVMMPLLNGFELTEKLKKDERTCHIPIILLTAKADDADKFIGLETGADDYLVKPFKIKGLETRVRNLITSRLKLRERYSQELILRPKDIALTNFDERFLEKMQAVLDQNLTESSFSVEDFSKAIGMSRMQLHRKLKALTGLSATEFIRSQRLKLAANLLKSSNANVSEIGYTVGFNDHSYFTKCFKEAYGCSPTEYAKS